MRLTSHSEIGKIKSLFIKNVQQAFISQAHIEQHWKDLNYTGKPELATALDEYEVFESILKSTGADIYYLPEDDSVNMDSIYCRDASIATDDGMIICNMGKAGRMNEPGAEERAFEAHGIKVLGRIHTPGTIEGGDLCWLDEKTLAVGHTYRTNYEGIRQLTELLEPLQVEVITVPLPHYRGPADVFHLMSILSPVDKDLAVVYSPLMPIAFRKTLLKKGFHLIEVSDDEFESMGCNVLALAPRECLVVEGSPETKMALEKAGCKVISYKGSEISVKGGGGPTCLTRPVHRFA